MASDWPREGGREEEEGDEEEEKKRERERERDQAMRPAMRREREELVP